VPPGSGGSGTEKGQIVDGRSDAPPPRFSDEHRVASIIKKTVITDTSQVELTLAALLADYYV
jgi:hypothetical protein